MLELRLKQMPERRLRLNSERKFWQNSEQTLKGSTRMPVTKDMTTPAPSTPPSTTRLRVTPKLKTQIRVSFGGLYIAGITYWLSRLFLKHQGEYGPEPSSLENWAGPIHLIFALLFLSVMGIVWTMHISPALRNKKNRWTGWVFILWIVALAFSGIGIIYGREALVNVLVQYHQWCGALMLPTLVVHWMRRR